MNIASLIFDLGGGTLDVSRVAFGEREHSLLALDGIPVLGGDFEAILRPADGHGGTNFRSSSKKLKNIFLARMTRWPFCWPIQSRLLNFPWNQVAR